MTTYIKRTAQKTQIQQEIMPFIPLPLSSQYSRLIKASSLSHKLQNHTTNPKQNKTNFQKIVSQTATCVISSTYYLYDKHAHHCVLFYHPNGFTESLILLVSRCATSHMHALFKQIVLCIQPFSMDPGMQRGPKHATRTLETK